MVHSVTWTLLALRLEATGAGLLQASIARLKMFLTNYIELTGRVDAGEVIVEEGFFPITCPDSLSSFGRTPLLCEVPPRSVPSVDPTAVDGRLILWCCSRRSTCC